MCLIPPPRNCLAAGNESHEPAYLYGGWNSFARGLDSRRARFSARRCFMAVLSWCMDMSKRLVARPFQKQTHQKNGMKTFFYYKHSPLKNEA